MSRKQECIAVVGLGRFGMMWAALLAQHAEAGGYRLIGYNRTPKRIDDPALKAAVRIVPPDGLAEATIIFICVAISSLPQVLSAVRPFIADDAIVCDTCSVKEYPQRWMRTLLPKRCALLGTHPMFGPDSLTVAARLPIVFCPIRISDAALRRCTDLFALWGLQAIRMTAQRHDKMVAYSQGFTHLIGRIADSMRLTQTGNRYLRISEATTGDGADLQG